MRVEYKLMRQLLVIGLFILISGGSETEDASLATNYLHIHTKYALEEYEIYSRFLIRENEEYMSPFVRYPTIPPRADPDSMIRWLRNRGRPHKVVPYTVFINDHSSGGTMVAPLWDRKMHRR